MRKTRILSFLIVCAVAPAFAQRTPEPDVVPTENVIQSFEKAKITLAEAIRIAAKKHKDAKVVDVSFDSQAGQLAYKVKTYQDNNVWEGAVDASTGQIIGDGTTTPVSKLDDEDKLELAGLQKASIDLATATARAEERVLEKRSAPALKRPTAGSFTKITKRRLKCPGTLKS